MIAYLEVFQMKKTSSRRTSMWLDFSSNDIHRELEMRGRRRWAQISHFGKLGGGSCEKRKRRRGKRKNPWQWLLSYCWKRMGKKEMGWPFCKKGGCGSHHRLNLSGLKHRFLGPGCNRRRREKCSS